MNTQKINSGVRGLVKPPGGVQWKLPLVLLLLLIAAPIIAEDRPYARADRVDAKVQTEIKRQEIVGLAVVMIDDGKIAWTKGYGFADREKKVPVDPAVTQFRWASISKPVTAVAALQLAEKGLLDLDADVRTCPSFPTRG